MQICPELRNFPQVIFLAAAFRLAVSSTITGDFPPNSRVTVLRFSAAAFMTIFPTPGEPVKKIWSKGSLSSARDTSIFPSTIVISFSGKSCLTIFAITAEVRGVSSEGFKMAVFPAAIADTSGPKVRFTGKFQGEIIRQVPFGSYRYQEEVPVSERGVGTRCSAIHLLKWSLACLISLTTWYISVRSVSMAGFLKSPNKACCSSPRKVFSTACCRECNFLIRSFQPVLPTVYWLFLCDSNRACILFNFSSFKALCIIQNSFWTNLLLIPGQW